MLSKNVCSSNFGSEVSGVDRSTAERIYFVARHGTTQNFNSTSRIASAFSPLLAIVVKGGLASQHVMVVLSEAVGFVADIL